ncbi:hypothetical protein D7V93_34460 [Corallococcus llansteffanensis]|uniref:Uncharacterized protein n=1 Tax=Corallococcus llansteffanensis TaxID=2316731 RepID=A0A3A8NU37_9BACT|nr:hypothetical protein D7V93_34460 [Corallococcus llansteffanensis]
MASDDTTCIASAAECVQQHVPSDAAMKSTAQAAQTDPFEMLYRCGNGEDCDAPKDVCVVFCRDRGGLD